MIFQAPGSARARSPTETNRIPRIFDPSAQKFPPRSCVIHGLKILYRLRKFAAALADPETVGGANFREEASSEVRKLKVRDPGDTFEILNSSFVSRSKRGTARAVPQTSRDWNLIRGSGEVTAIVGSRDRKDSARAPGISASFRAEGDVTRGTAEK